jgi:hypothetical protein
MLKYVALFCCYSEHAVLCSHNVVKSTVVPLIALCIALLIYRLSTVREFVPLGPPINITYESMSCTILDTALNEEVRVLVLIHLL